MSTRKVVVNEKSLSDFVNIWFNAWRDLFPTSTSQLDIQKLGDMGSSVYRTLNKKGSINIAESVALPVPLSMYIGLRNVLHHAVTLRLKSMFDGGVPEAEYEQESLRSNTDLPFHKTATGNTSFRDMLQQIAASAEPDYFGDSSFFRNTKMYLLVSGLDCDEYVYIKYEISSALRGVPIFCYVLLTKKGDGDYSTRINVRIPAYDKIPHRFSMSGKHSVSKLGDGIVPHQPVIVQGKRRFIHGIDEPGIPDLLVLKDNKYSGSSLNGYYCSGINEDCRLPSEHNPFMESLYWYVHNFLAPSVYWWWKRGIDNGAMSDLARMFGYSDIKSIAMPIEQKDTRKYATDYHEMLWIMNYVHQWDTNKKNLSRLAVMFKHFKGRAKKRFLVEKGKSKRDFHDPYTRVNSPRLSAIREECSLHYPDMWIISSEDIEDGVGWEPAYRNAWETDIRLVEDYNHEFGYTTLKFHPYIFLKKRNVVFEYETRKQVWGKLREALPPGHSLCQDDLSGRLIACGKVYTAV